MQAKVQKSCLQKCGIAVLLDQLNEDSNLPMKDTFPAVDYSETAASEMLVLLSQNFPLYWNCGFRNVCAASPLILVQHPIDGNGNISCEACVSNAPPVRSRDSTLEASADKACGQELSLTESSVIRDVEFLSCIKKINLIEISFGISRKSNLPRDIKEEVDSNGMLVSAIDNQAKRLVAADGRVCMNFEIASTGCGHNYSRSYYMNGRDNVIRKRSDEQVVRVCCARSGRRLKDVCMADLESDNHVFVQSLRGDPFRVSFPKAVMIC